MDKIFQLDQYTVQIKGNVGWEYIKDHGGRITVQEQIHNEQFWDRYIAGFLYMKLNDTHDLTKPFEITLIDISSNKFIFINCRISSYSDIIRKPCLYFVAQAMVEPGKNIKVCSCCTKDLFVECTRCHNPICLDCAEKITKETEILCPVCREELGKEVIQ